MSTNTVSMTCASRTVTVASSVTAGALTISTGTLTVNSGATLTVASLTMTGGTLTVNGTLNVITGNISITGGSVGGNGTIGLTGPTQTISVNQALPNLNVAGSGNKTMTGNLTITNKLTLTSNNLIVGNNTLTVGSSNAGSGITATNGKLTLATGSSLSFGGSWTNNDISSFISNTWPVTINNFTLTRNLVTLGLGTNKNLTVNGAFNLTAGDFRIGASTLTLNGTISGNINGALIGGSTSDLVIGGSGSANMYFDLANTNAGGSNTIRNLTINRTSHPFVMLSSLRIGGTLNQASSASLQISNGSMQTLHIDGTVNGTARLVGSSTASLSINGSGNLGGSITFPSGAQLSNLTMNRIGGTATIATGLSVSSMNLTFGVINAPNGITVTGGASGNVAQTVSSSYVNGPLARTIAAGTDSTSFSWPIGASASQKFTLNGLTTSSAVVITAQAFDANAGGTADGSISDLRTDNYWMASVTSNPSGLVSVGTVSLSDTGLVDGDAVGHSASMNGTYSSLGGAVASGAVTSTLATPTTLGYYVIGTGGAICTDPTVPTVSASSLTNCGTQTTTLSIASGSLNSATTWTWYAGSCGGTAIGTGNSIQVAPVETTTYYVRGEGGCITPGACASVTITVSTPEIWYADADGDSYGNPNAAILACSQPTGYVSNNADCNDQDGTRWQMGSFYVDADGDGYDAGIADVCYGTSAPAGYSETTQGSDCNDVDAAVFTSGQLYVDVDGDGFTGGETAEVCYGDSVPAGYLADLTEIDCNDAMNTVYPGAPEIPYNGIDEDCNGTIDDGSQVFSQVQASQCGTTLSTIGSLVGLVSVPYATGYRIEATDLSTGAVHVIERTVPNFSMMGLPSYEYATTYSVRVMVQRNGIWLNYYGQACNVSTPPITAPGGAAQVTPSQCNITLAKINTLIATTSLPGVAQYRFRVTDLTDTDGPNQVQIIDRTQHWFSLPMLARYNYGTTYTVEVAVRTTNSTQFGEFGSACQIASPAVPVLLGCGEVIPNNSTYVSTTSVAGATSYRFVLTDLVDYTVTTFDRPQHWFTFGMFSGYVPGRMYGVQVAVMTSGEWSPMGEGCEITAPGGARENVKESVVAFDAVAYPNPFADSFNIRLDSSAESDVKIKVYDMTGRMLENKSVSPAEVQKMTIGESFPAGVYNVIVSQRDDAKTLRVIKR